MFLCSAKEGKSCRFGLTSDEQAHGDDDRIEPLFCRDIAFFFLSNDCVVCSFPHLST